MSSLTERYNQAQINMREHKKKDDHYTDVFNKTPYLVESLKYGSSDFTRELNRKAEYYEKSLPFQFSNEYVDLAKKLLFEEAIPLIGDDKWQTLQIPTIDEVDRYVITNTKHEMVSRLNCSGKFRWADGSIHHTGFECAIGKHYEVKSGLFSSIVNEKRQNKARVECFAEAQEFYRLVQEAAYGVQEHITLSFFDNSYPLTLYKDGSVFTENKYYLEQISVEKLESHLLTALNHLMLYK